MKLPVVRVLMTDIHENTKKELLLWLNENI